MINTIMFKQRFRAACREFMLIVKFRISAECWELGIRSLADGRKNTRPI